MADDSPPKSPRSISKKLRFEVFKRDSFTCQYCGRKAPDVVLEIEHVQPVSAGGDADILNLLTSCTECNAGKGARLLSDSAVLDRQRAQLEALQARREQIDMMIEWKKSLRSLDAETAERVAAYLLEQIPGFTLNDAGLVRIQKWLARYDIDEITTAIDISFRQYMQFAGDKPTEESVCKAFNLVEAIARNRRREKDEPEIRDLFYARGIARKRCGYFRDDLAIEMLRRAYALGVDVEELKDIARGCRNWTGWRRDMEALIFDLEREQKESS